MLTMRQKQAITATIKKRYTRSSKQKKTQILEEFCQTTGYNRSYARRVLGSKEPVGRKRKRTGKKRMYTADVFYPLRTLWIAADGICGKRLNPYLPELIRVMEEKKEIRLNKRIRKQLLTISAATIDRMLTATRKQYQLKGKATTRPGTLLRSTIAVRTFNDWSDITPGYFETDLVAFCGSSVRGEYINGLNLTDVATGWVGLEAVMGKGQYRVYQAIDRVRGKLFFQLKGLDPDNGTEFINWHLHNYCQTNNITFTRIRPNRKNDNCYVEQKNYTVLRRFFGYARYETEQQLQIIQEMLPLVEDYVNFFQPVMKLKSKERVGSKMKKKYDQAQTPYRRLLDSGVVTEENKRQIQEKYHTLNPMDLKRRINKLTVKLNETLRYISSEATNP